MRSLGCNNESRRDLHPVIAGQRDIGCCLSRIAGIELAAGQTVYTEESDIGLEKMVHGSAEEQVIFIADTGLVVQTDTVIGEGEIVRGQNFGSLEPVTR